MKISQTSSQVGARPTTGLMKTKKKTKKQLKAAAERSAEIIERITTQPRMAFKNSVMVTQMDYPERNKIMKAKTKNKATARKPATTKGIKGKSGLSVCATWLKAFSAKSIGTAAACSKKMKTEFPARKSKIFNFPNIVIARANKGLLDGKSHKFKKYAN